MYEQPIKLIKTVTCRGLLVDVSKDNRINKNYYPPLYPAIREVVSTSIYIN
jgi:hypothetical protein